MILNEIQCKSALTKCGFPGGGLTINPYVGCLHGCIYCYARFMKRFTGHEEEWGTFIDVKTNIADVLQKEVKSSRFKDQKIFISTVTDPYQPLEKKYQLTRKILEILKDYDNPINILTKSDLVLRDLDLLKQFKNIDVNFTINTLDEKWQGLSEPAASTAKKRLEAASILSKEGIGVIAMMGPYWPVFTNPDELFREFNRVGIKQIFSESLNTMGQNWQGVERMIKNNYPELLKEFQNIFFNPHSFYEFYENAKDRIMTLSAKYNIPVNIFFNKKHN
jgi:DNA repair photolyase